jgi:hypothetical protein
MAGVMLEPQSGFTMPEPAGEKAILDIEPLRPFRASRTLRLPTLRLPIACR